MTSLNVAFVTDRTPFIALARCIRRFNVCFIIGILAYLQSVASFDGYNAFFWQPIHWVHLGTFIQYLCLAQLAGCCICRPILCHFCHFVWQNKIYSFCCSILCFIGHTVHKEQQNSNCHSSSRLLYNAHDFKRRLPVKPIDWSMRATKYRFSVMLGLVVRPKFSASSPGSAKPALKVYNFYAVVYVYQSVQWRFVICDFCQRIFI